MTDLQILAKAILELAEKAAHEWDYDGEQMLSTGVALDFEIQRELERIVRKSDD